MNHPAPSAGPPPRAASDLPSFGGLEVDDLLAELSERAAAARVATDRLRALLDAVVAVTSDLDLEAVLQRIVSAGCAVADAEYGALGVLGDDDELAEFVTNGITDEQRALIGPPPRLHGVLGLLVEDPRPIRVSDVTRHPRAYGLPAHHPPIRTFLGVPIRIGDDVFGNLYLAEKRGGREFTVEDEELVVALAKVAGTAIEKARLYEDARHREDWLEAEADITEALLSRARRPDALSLVARRARETAHADIAAVLLPYDDGYFVVEVADGDGAEALVDMPVPVAGPLADVVARGTPVVTGAGTLGTGMARLLLAPMQPEPHVRGALVVGWAGELLRAPTPQEVRMVAGFAEQAALALELARGQADRARLAVYEDRDRIGRDLHDSVVQRLFAVGLSLRAVRQGTLSEEARAERVARAVADLDATVKDIRRTIFRLHTRPGEGDLSADIEDVVSAAEGSLGFTPSLRVDVKPGSVPADVAEHVVAVVRESLSNVARHAGAKSAEVQITAGDDIEVVVVDDGRGIRPGGRRSGLANMAERAQLAGGSFSVTAREGGGTEVRWSVPLPRADAAGGVSP